METTITRPKTHPKQPSVEAPLSGEDMLMMQDQPDRAMPDALQKELATPRIYLEGISHRSMIEDCLSAVETKEGTWALKLPTGASLGLAGQTGERLNRAAAGMSGIASTPPHQPEWSGVSYQPHAAAAFHHGRMRTIKDRTIEPFYGVYNTPDARQVYYPRAYPWRCTGRIFTYTNWPTPNWSWSGSGVLVGPRHVLTAGHVAPWGSQSWAMLFVPAYWDGVSVYGAGASSYVSDYRGWNTNNQVAAHDISVLRLYQPLGSQLGWIGTRTYDDDWEGGNYWTMTGYPGAVAGASRPAYQSSISVLDDDEDGSAQEIEHHGDSSPGESGGPMYGFWNDGPHAIGTTSGGERISGGIFGIGNEDNNIAAGGGAMVDLVKWGLSNWP